MKRHTYAISILASIVFVSLACSCNIIKKENADEQSIRDSLAHLDSIEKRQESLVKSGNPLPPFSKIFSYYKKARDIGWLSVKGELKDYMKGLNQNLVFDDEYKYEEYDDQIATFSALAYGENFVFLKEENDYGRTGHPYYGIIFKTWINDLDYPDTIEIFFSDEDDYEQYLQEIYDSGFNRGSVDGCSILCHGYSGKGFRILITPEH